MLTPIYITSMIIKHSTLFEIILEPSRKADVQKLRLTKLPYSRSQEEFAYLQNLKEVNSKPILLKFYIIFLNRPNSLTIRKPKTFQNILADFGQFNTWLQFVLPMFNREFIDANSSLHIHISKFIICSAKPKHYSWIEYEGLPYQATFRKLRGSVVTYILIIQNLSWWVAVDE